MAFVVTQPIEVTALGVFDDNQNGITGATQLDVAIWQRDDNGTPFDISDDSGVGIVAQTSTFTSSDQGTLMNVFRVKNLDSPVTLNPGAYTISAGGFDDDNMLNNVGFNDGTPNPTINDSVGTIKFFGGNSYFL